VTDVNEPPVLGGLPASASIPERVPYRFTATASDPDLPANALTFSLIGAPQGAAIDPGSGVFTWTPDEAQGPGSYSFRVRVTDAGGLSDERPVTLDVTEVNVAPVLDPIQNLTVLERQRVTFTAHASDADLPANTLTFSLRNAPQGAAIDPVSG